MHTGRAAWYLTADPSQRPDTRVVRRATGFAQHRDFGPTARPTARWDSLLTVKLLHVTGGVGSPVNATALRRPRCGSRRPGRSVLLSSEPDVNHLAPLRS
ncbi:hypothetical protein B1R27_13190 [Streptomyces sp. GKU 895]|nr:hypothetical protein B1R27_13190 [Streptomyces sp. GKU 895]